MSVAGLETEFAFTLPKGFIDGAGTLHRQGIMRLATARDEIEPLRDPRVTGPDDPYLTILVLSRVIVELGSLPSIGVREIENLFAADLAFMQDLYGIINFGSPADVAALQRAATGPDEVVEAAPPPAEAPVAGDNGSAGTVEDSVNRAAKATSNRRRERIEEVARPSGS